jgi:hypothetical protein
MSNLRSWATSSSLKYLVMKNYIILEAYRRKYASENSVFRGSIHYNPNYKYPELSDLNEDTINICQEQIVQMFKSLSKSMVSEVLGTPFLKQQYTLENLLECILDKTYAFELKSQHEAMMEKARVLKEYLNAKPEEL